MNGLSTAAASLECQLVDGEEGIVAHFPKGEFGSMTQIRSINRSWYLYLSAIFVLYRSNICFSQSYLGHCLLIYYLILAKTPRYVSKYGYNKYNIFLLPDRLPTSSSSHDRQSIRSIPQQQTQQAGPHRYEQDRSLSDCKLALDRNSFSKRGSRHHYPPLYIECQHDPGNQTCDQEAEDREAE